MTTVPKPEGLAGMAQGALDKAKIKLDTRKALDEVKNDIESGKTVDIDKALNHIKTKSKISDEKWNEVKADVRSELENAILSQTPEAKALAAKAQDTLRTGLPKVTATEEKAKGWIESLKQRFSGFADIFPFIGSWFASMAVEQKKDGKPTFLSGLYDKIAGWFGHETPQAKFDKFRSEVTLPEGYAFGDHTDSQVNIRKTSGEKVAKLVFNAETGSVTLVTDAGGSYEYKDAADLNSNLTADKLTVAAAPAQTPATPEKPAELSEADKKIVDSFKEKFIKDKSWSFAEANINSDLKTLKDDSRTKDKKPEDLIKDNKNIPKISEAVGKIITDKKNEFSLRLTDLMFETYTDDQNKKIVEIIEDAGKEDKDRKFKLGKAPKDVRDFLNTATSDFDKSVKDMTK